jgi:hypothetical protein
VSHADELEALVPALRHVLCDLADSGHVGLLLELRLDRAPLDSEQRPLDDPYGTFTIAWRLSTRA